jgi:hypothetical protein
VFCGFDSLVTRIDSNNCVVYGDYWVDDRLGEPSANVPARMEARGSGKEGDSASQRGESPHNGVTCNADMGGKEHRCPAQIWQTCQLNENSNSLMRRNLLLRL